MKKDKYVPLIFLLFPLAFFLQSSGKISYLDFLIKNPMYILAVAVPIIIVAAVISKYKNSIRKVFIKASIDNSLYDIVMEDGEYYFVAFRVLGKETGSIKVNYESELKLAIDAIQRNKTRYLKTAIITLLDPVPGTAILFYMKKSDKISKDFLLNEAMILKSTIESVAQHISLETVDLKTNQVLPMPKTLGTVVYGGYVVQKKYEVTSDSIIFGEYDIELGRTVDVNQIPVGIRSIDIFKHVSIFGATGNGKSNTSALLAKELYEKGFDVIILDWHGEYREYLSQFNYYGQQNPLVLNPIAVDEQSSMDISEMMADAIELTEPQMFLLYLAIEQLRQSKEFSTKKLLEAISALSIDSPSQKDVKFALARKIMMLSSSGGDKLVSSKNGLTYKELAEKLKGGNIIDLSFIKNINLRKLYAMLFLKFLIEYYMEKKDPNRKVYIVLEEAQNYLGEHNRVLIRALQEIRKFNVGLAIITQSPTSINAEVLKNTNIKIVHAIKSNDDKKIVGGTIGLQGDKIDMLDKLDVGQAIVVAPNLRKEVVVKIKKIV